MVRELTIGGCERDLTKIAKGLDRARFTPHVGCFRSQGLRGDELRRAGIPVVEFPVRSLKSFGALRAFRQMARYLEEHGIRLIHAYDVPMNIYGLPVGWLCGRATLSSQLCYRGLCSPLTRFLLRFGDALVDRIVVNCEAMRRHMIDDERVPASRVYLSYNGVDTREFRPLEEPPPEALRGAPLVIGAVCAFRPEKNLPLLMEAFARVRSLKPGMKLALVGSGPVEEELKALCRRLRLEDDCVFEPMTAAVARWMRAIQIFALPSLSEAFSNGLLEAMACGCCPVGSRVGGTPELIEHERRGLLFENGNLDDLTAQLRRAIQDEPLRKAMAAEASRFAHQRLSVEFAVERMERLYSSLL